MFRVIRGAETAFNPWPSSSRYYLLSFEPDHGDRDTKVSKISRGPAEGGRRRARRNEFRWRARARSTGEHWLTRLRPILATEIGMKLAAYSFTESSGDKLR